MRTTFRSWIYSRIRITYRTRAAYGNRISYRTTVKPAGAGSPPGPGTRTGVRLKLFFFKESQDGLWYENYLQDQLQNQDCLESLQAPYRAQDHIKALDQDQELVRTAELRPQSWLASYLGQPPEPQTTGCGTSEVQHYFTEPGPLQNQRTNSRARGLPTIPQTGSRRNVRRGAES